MRGQEGSSTVTYRLKLHYKNIKWLELTKELYNKVMLFYYNLLLEHMDFLELGNQKVMRELEKLTIISRDKHEPSNPLPYERIPVYFRRAAISSAIGIVRTYHTKYLTWMESTKAEEVSTEKPEKANGFNAQPVFYKGMYKEFEDDSIKLKLWSGTSWIWVKHKVSGRKLPEDAIIMSPTVSVSKNKAMLHVPVKSKVSDVRNVNERMEDGERICAVSLSSSDTLAVCTVLESNGHIIHSCFVRGGDELKHRRKRLLGKIALNHRQSGGINKSDRNNTELYHKLKNITDYYSHLVSRRIIDFCKKHEVKIIVFQDIGMIVPLKDKKYTQVNENDFIIRRIVRYTEYKAFAYGIVVTRVRPNYTSCKCYQCRAYVKKHNMKENRYGKNYVCENGHQGNAYLNTSKNIGLMFLKKAEVIKAAKSGKA